MLFVLVGIYILVGFEYRWYMVFIPLSFLFSDPVK